MTASESERGLTPRVDEIALRHEMKALTANEANAQFNDLLSLARQLERELQDLSSAGPVAWQVVAKGGRFTRGIYEKPTADDFEIWRLDGDTAIPLFAHPAAQPWQPIESAPLGEMVRLIGGGWRHEWCGQVIDRETGECVLDSPTPEHAVGRYFARYWKGFDMPPAAQEPKA